MAVSKKDSPNRRKSIAVTSHKPTVPKGRRRAHSIVPGDKLSPRAKARRSLAPRKSILKASINALDADEPPQEDSQSMDLTIDYSARISDYNGPKSFGRRVSFARDAQVRFFNKKKNNHANSTGSPQSSAAAALNDQPGVQQQRVTNENVYPAASASNRRRSSVRQSMGSEDMDLTTIGPSKVMVGSGGNESVDIDDNSQLDNCDESMEVTEVIHGDFFRKRSLSTKGRQPLSQIHSASSRTTQEQPFSEDADITGNESLSQSDMSDQSQVMDFTIPLNQSLRPPAHEDEVWVALRKATHSGHTISEPEPYSDDDNEGVNMGLDDAVTRLMRARDSLPLARSGDQQPVFTQPQEDSTMSMDDSYDIDNYDDNQTVNVSKVLGRFSLASPTIGRESLGYQESTMDESELYDAAMPPTHSTPRQSLAQPEPSPLLKLPEQLLKTTVFQPPPTNTSSNPTVPAPMDQNKRPAPTFIPKQSSESRSVGATSPSKAKARPTFSAAFAPPVSKSPKKITQSQNNGQSNPSKLPHLEIEGGVDQESVQSTPVRRRALSTTQVNTTALPTVEGSVAHPSISTTAPSSRSPIKNIPRPSSANASSRLSSTLRRPSGYLARRKSFNVGLVPGTSENATDSSKLSPRKLPVKGPGRASLGSTPQDTSTRFEGHDHARLGDKGRDSSENNAIPQLVQAAENQFISLVTEPSPPHPQHLLGEQHSPTTPLPPPVADNNMVDLSNMFNPGDIEESATETGMDIDATDATQQWRESVHQKGYDDGEVPGISIDQFFSMTGIKFMDELTAPRRSIHQPSRQSRHPEEIKLSEYVTAIGIELPQLALYSRISKDLQAWMEKSKEVFAEAEIEAAKVTPELFVEYSRADEDGQAELLHQLNLIRTNTRGLAKSDWYDWKLQWVEGLRVPADKGFHDLETDARALEELRAKFNELVPALEQQYEDLMKELAQEQQEIAEIEASNQDYLNELKATIAEQNIEVEALKAEVAEGNDKLKRLDERWKEIDGQKQETRAAISYAENVLRIQANSTQTEVFRLKDELEALEDLHMFRATRVNMDSFEYVHNSQFLVSIPCKSFAPIPSKVKIARLEKVRTRYKDDFPQLSNFLLNHANQLITSGRYTTVREIVHRLADYWSSCTHVRSQLKLLNIKYPITLDTFGSESGQPGFKANAMVMFPSVRGKAHISFTFSAETFARWPTSIDNLSCEVVVKYGALDQSKILKSVTERLNQASASENHACLLDACIEAQDIYR